MLMHSHKISSMVCCRVQQKVNGQLVVIDVDLVICSRPTPIDNEKSNGFKHISGMPNDFICQHYGTIVLLISQQLNQVGQHTDLYANDVLFMSVVFVAID
jgi:hypothetical protein